MFSHKLYDLPKMTQSNTIKIRVTYYFLRNNRSSVKNGSVKSAASCRWVSCNCNRTDEYIVQYEYELLVQSFDIYLFTVRTRCMMKPGRLRLRLRYWLFTVHAWSWSGAPWSFATTRRLLKALAKDIISPTLASIAVWGEIRVEWCFLSAISFLFNLRSSLTQIPFLFVSLRCRAV